jgi:hypothetical protein
MKKLFTRILPLLAIVLLVSCNDDDSKPEPTVIGTWHLTGYYDYTAEEFTPVEECYHESKTFNSDGTGADNVTDCGNAQAVYPFLWEKGETKNAYNFIIEGDMIIPELIYFEGNNKMTITFGDDSAKVYERMLDE